MNKQQVRKQIFAGNWKMYTTKSKAVELAIGIASGMNCMDREVVLFPPSVYATCVIDACEGTPVKVGLQNMFYEKEGAYTGELSPRMLKDVGAGYVLVGHSERRHIFGETDELIHKKVISAIAFDIIPVLCVGELLEERELGKSESTVESQLIKAFAEIGEQGARKAVIAYEPVWAIGTGKVATPEIAESMHTFIRNTLKKLYNDSVAMTIPVLYGGSVKPDNIAGLYAMPNIDGVLVGGASLTVQSFLDIINVTL
ncbi:MAG TPA: triose-phosphate isomerase [Spirochaetota bacterium]|nr:triose-phosphate isomerase [Spirochaetota bacterium]